MQVPTQISPTLQTPAARHGDAQRTASGNAGFGDVFEFDERAREASGNEAPPTETAGAVESPAAERPSGDQIASVPRLGPTPEHAVREDILGESPHDVFAATIPADDARPLPARTPALPAALLAAVNAARGVEVGAPVPEAGGDATPATTAPRPTSAGPAEVTAVSRAVHGPGKAVPTGETGATAPAEAVVVRRGEAAPGATGGRATAMPDAAPPQASRNENAARDAARIGAAVGADTASPASGDASTLDHAQADVPALDGKSAADAPARTETAARHELPRPVSTQIADAARALRDGPVELTLKPEELGTVRMTLSTGSDGAMTVVLHAERPETLELLRRHIGDLARDLGDLGFDSLDLQFSDDRRPPKDPQTPASDTADPRIATIEMAPNPFIQGRAVATGTGGLDLRL